MDENLVCLVVDPNGLCYYLNMDLIQGLTQAFIIFWGLCLMFQLILNFMR